MDLTATQTDSLTELINIGYGRAAAALSEMTGHRVMLEVPRIAMYELAEVGPLLGGVLRGEVACVNQVFSGAIAGTALLLLDDRAALMLSRLMTDEAHRPATFDPMARETVTEVGNIVLNACLGVFGNLLDVQVRFTVPRLEVTTIDHMLRSVRVASENLTHALLIRTRFSMRQSNVSGYICLVLGVTSLSRVLEQIEKWEAR